MVLRKFLIGIDAIGLIIGIIIGIDYSYYIANIKYVDNTTTVILDEVVTLNCKDKEININNENINIKDTYEKEFEVTNLSDKETFFNILLDDVVNNYEGHLIYELYNEDKLIVSNTVAPLNGKNYIKLNVGLKAAESKKFKIRFNLNNKDNKEDEYFADKSFNAILQINSLTINSEIKTATNYLLANNNIYDTSSKEYGLYKMYENDKVIYYYKGNVNNNFVKFNDEMWRIVRINEDGSIKIIKNDNTSDAISFSDDKTSDTAGSYFTSNVKNRLNGYYNEIVKNYESMLVAQDYCLNLTVVRNDNYKIAETDKSINDYNIVIKCSDQNKSLIGVLSYNDAVLAGLNYNVQHDNYLLDTNNVNTWLSTSAGVNNYNNDHYVWYLDKNSIKDTSVSSENSIRPVINLKATLNLVGSGTIEDPYIFSE